jgi:hypothetical protein
VSTAVPLALPRSCSIAARLRREWVSRDHCVHIALPFDTAYADTMARTSICLANGLIGDAR